MRQTRTRLTVERLETRDCPAVAYTFYDTAGAVLAAGNVASPAQVSTISGDATINGTDLGFSAANVGAISLTGDGAANTFDLSQFSAGDYSALTAGSIDGAGTPCTLTGPPASTYTVNAINAGTLGAWSFDWIGSLVGSGVGNTYSIGNAAGVAHAIVGTGTDTLSYATRTSGVVVNLQTDIASATGGVSGINTVIGTNGGNDILLGAAGAGLLGGTGNEVLVGVGGGCTLESNAGSFRNLLIGEGAGNTFLSHSMGGDIWVAGSTIYDQNTTALSFLMREWVRTDVSYVTRIGHLMGMIGGGYNGAYYLKSGNVVTDGDSVNTATSSEANAGQNWYIAKVNTIDWAFIGSRKKAGETLTAE